MTERYNTLLALVEKRLAELFTQPGLEEAMRYSLLAGGKRVRPVLTLAFCELASGRAEEALDFACAVECLHTYSLIHDDLPLMDNDDLRRGRPTCHKVFGEGTAALAGDALQAAAFRLVAEAGFGFDNRNAALEAVRVLADMAGENGMCLGQFWDTTPGARTAEDLTRINDKKTGCLLRAACTLGVLAAQGHRAVSADLTGRAERYGAALGRAFQIRDDMLDAISTESELGKPIGSDAENGKETFATLWGIDRCQEAVLAYTQDAILALEGCTNPAADFLRNYAGSLAERKN